MWLQDECLLALIPGCDMYAGVASRLFAHSPPKKEKRNQAFQAVVLHAGAMRLSIFSYIIYLFTGRWLLTVGLHKVFLMLALTPS